MTSKTKQMTSYLCIICAAALWGSIGVFLRFLMAGGLSRLQVVFVRTSSAALLLLIYLLAADRDKLRIALKDWYLFFGTGVVSLLFFNLCYFAAINITSMSVAAVLLYTAPIFVMLMSVKLFGERITARKLFALAATFVGCIFVCGLTPSGAAIPLKGLIFGLGAGFGYSLYTIFGRYALKKYSSLTISFYTFVFASCAALPFASPADALQKLTAAPGMSAMGLGVGVVTCLFPYILYTAGLSRVEGSKASIMATLEPLVATLLGFILFKESLSIYNVIGIVLIVGAIVLLNTGPASQKGPQPE